MTKLEGDTSIFHIPRQNGQIKGTNPKQSNKKMITNGRPTLIKSLKAYEPGAETIRLVVVPIGVRKAVEALTATVIISG